MKKLFLSTLIVLSAVITPKTSLAGELLSVGEIFQDRQGRNFYPFTFAVAPQALKDCSENNGKGNWDYLFLENAAVRRFSCSVLLAPLEQMRNFDPAFLADTFNHFSHPQFTGVRLDSKNETEKVFFQTTRSGMYTFKKAGFSPIYLDGVKHNFEGFNRAVDGHYLEFQVKCTAYGAFQRGRDESKVDEKCSTEVMMKMAKDVSPQTAAELIMNAKVPKGHQDYSVSPFGI